jgi:hypothetical protein
MKPVALILCGALAREVLAIVARHQWPVHIEAISAREHMTPRTIAPLVEQKIRALLPRFERIAVVYGDCGTGGALDRVLDTYNVPRISGPHCYEMYAGAQQHDAIVAAQPGTFFLTDFLLRGFDGLVWKGLGLDRHPELIADYFAHYTQLVYLAQTTDAALLEKAQNVAQRLNLPLEIRNTGYGALELRLIELMQTIAAPAHEHQREMLLQDHVDNLSDSLLARHSVTGARPRRSRARQRRAERPLSGSD